MIIPDIPTYNIFDIEIISRILYKIGNYPFPRPIKDVVSRISTYSSITKDEICWCNELIFLLSQRSEFIRFFELPAGESAIAVAQLTKHHIASIPYDYQTHHGLRDATEYKRWYIFDKLMVPQECRNIGIGSNLLEKVIEWADQADACIYNPLAPESNREEDLRRFYLQHGFIKGWAFGTMIKIPNR